MAILDRKIEEAQKTLADLLVWQDRLTAEQGQVALRIAELQQDLAALQALNTPAE
jgi:hypothetical protein